MYVLTVPSHSSLQQKTTLHSVAAPWSVQHRIFHILLSIHWTLSARSHSFIMVLSHWKVWGSERFSNKGFYFGSEQPERRGRYFWANAFLIQGGGGHTSSILRESFPNPFRIPLDRLVWFNITHDSSRTLSERFPNRSNASRITSFLSVHYPNASRIARVYTDISTNGQNSVRNSSSAQNLNGQHATK